MFNNDNLVIRKVKGMGRGVFTLRPIKKGDIVEMSPGIPLSPGDMEFIEKTLLQFYVYQCEDNEAFSMLALGFGSLFNNSDDPNIDFDVSYEDKMIVFTAIKDIPSDEQLFIDYSWEEE